MDKLMTLKEVAEYLQMHEMSVYRLAKRGSVPGFKVGGRWRFKKESIDAMFEESANGLRRLQDQAV